MDGRTGAIDLGEIPRSGPGVQWSPRSRSGRWRAAVPRRRPWLSVVAVLAALLMVAADATPTPPWAELRFTVPGESSYLDSERLYVVRVTRSTQRSITAYRLVDGAQLWQVSRGGGGEPAREPGAPVVRHGHSFTVQGGFPLHIAASLIRDGAGWRRLEAFTTAFDPATGHPLWTRPGSPTGPDPAVAGTESGDVLLLEQPGPTGSGPRGRIAVDPATGDIAWSTRKAPGWTRHADGHLIAMDHEGGLISYDIDTGNPLAATPAALDPDRADGPRIAGGLVLMWRRTSRPEVVAHEADTLAVRWRAPVPAGSIVGDCRTVVCVHGPRGVTALDPETGATRWSAEWPGTGLGRQQVRELRSPWPDGQVLLQFVEPTSEYTWLRKADTGEPLLDLDGWRPVPDAPRQPLLSRTEPTGRTWFGRLVLDPPSVRTLGAVGPTSWCRAVDRHLACQVDARVQVWRMRDEAPGTVGR